MTDLMSDYPIRRPAGHRNGLLSGGDAPTESYGPSEANDQYRRPELRAAPMSWRDRLLVALKGRNENIDYERQLE